MSAIAVIAKAPIAGRSKTRLCPPCTPHQAAALAAAALQDTLRVVSQTPVERRLLVLHGSYPTPFGFESIAQRGDGLAERLANAFEDAGGPLLLIGMDTPQVTPELLAHGIELLRSHRGCSGRRQTAAIGRSACSARTRASSPTCR